MSGHPSLERARVWLEQGRADRAEPELRNALAADPDDPVSHALLSLCLTELDRAREATEEAQLAIARAPDWPFAHYALAVAYVERGRVDEAGEAVGEALRLEPNDPDAWAVQGRIELLARRWDDAVEAAERGLAIDPEHVACTNVRATALSNRGDAESSAAGVREALARDPENSTTHAVAGWGCLQRGDMTAAGRHFSEALRIDPNNESARGGLLEVLKARNVVYRLMLRFFVWTGRQSSRTVWLVIIALWLAPKMLRSVAEKNPALAPFLYPVMAVLIGFIYLTWVVDPLFTALLFLHPLGRHALTSRERRKAIAVVACLGLALLCATLALTTPFTGLLVPAVLLLPYVIPLNVAFDAGERHRRLATGAAVGLGVVGLALLAAALVVARSADQSAADGLATTAAGVLAVVYLGGIIALSFMSTRWALDPRTD